MTLLPAELPACLPALHATEDTLDPLVQDKHFTPDANFTFYATEFDPKARVLFGLVHGFTSELGYLSLGQATTGTTGLLRQVALPVHCGGLFVRAVGFGERFREYR